jgi:hypothetical protein
MGKRVDAHSVYREIIVCLALSGGRDLYLVFGLENSGVLTAGTGGIRQKDG